MKNPRSSPCTVGANRTGPSSLVGMSSITRCRRLRGHRRKTLRHAQDRHDASRRPRAPDTVCLHLVALRRVLPLAEGRRAVRRRPSRRGRVPHRRGARAPRQHVFVDRRAVLAGARLRGLPGAAGGRARGVPPPPPHRGDAPERVRERGAALLARPDAVRAGGGRRPRERGGDRAQGLALAGRRRDRGDRDRRPDPDRRHRPDGVLRVLPAPPADAARHPRRDRRLAVAGGAVAARADRRGRRS